MKLSQLFSVFSVFVFRSLYQRLREKAFCIADAFPFLFYELSPPVSLLFFYFFVFRSPLVRFFDVRMVFGVTDDNACQRATRACVNCVN